MKDFKPANLLISSTGYLKIADFRLARVFQNKGNRSSGNKTMDGKKRKRLSSPGPSTESPSKRHRKDESAEETKPVIVKKEEKEGGEEIVPPNTSIHLPTRLVKDEPAGRRRSWHGRNSIERPLPASPRPSTSTATDSAAPRRRRMTADREIVAQRHVLVETYRPGGNRTIEDFTEQPGPHIPDGFDVHSASAIDFFWLVFPVRLLELIVRYTNRYAEWKQQQGGPDSYWQETTLPEMRAFIGINILMGIMQVPRLEQYWSSDPLYGNAGIQKVMTCNRFQKLSQYFHVSDREAEPARGTNEYDVLYKVREIMNNLLVSFRNAFTLNREVSVDEGMIKYAGRLSIRQYMPAKPIKRGVKVWMLCDANTGYLSKFEIYKGRENNRTEHGLGFNVVNKMTENIRNTFRWVFFDNYFTGIPLMRTLLQNGLYACGTVRTNRVGFPKDLVKPRDMPNRGDFKVVQNGDSNLTASVWKDTKLVHHLSTCSGPTDIRQAQRRVNRQAVLVRQPHSVHIYNRFMGGVDRHDQFRAKYPVGRNGKKWWHYIFWFLINSSIVNANIIYKEASRRITKRKRFEHLDFRMELVNQLIGGYAKRKRPSPDAGNFCGVLLQNAGAHVSSRLPGKKTTCKYHMRQLGQRRETVYGCVICNVHLCKDCHARFHDM